MQGSHTCMYLHGLPPKPSHECQSGRAIHRRKAARRLGVLALGTRAGRTIAAH